MIRWENASLLRGLFSTEIQHAMSNLNPLTERFSASLPPDFMKWDPLSRAQYIENTIFLSNYLLSSQGDRMAMAHAVEGRYPFLDYRVVEFAAKVPPFYRLRGLTDKFILRKAAIDLIPQELARRPKQPYRAPISRCFFGETPLPYVEELLSEKSLREKGYFNAGKITKLIDKIKNQAGHLLSERENMATIGVLSTQLLDEMYIKKYPFHPVREPENVKVYDCSQGCHP
jgi:asparagine synthase (glutamine-hydrolysing)